MMGRIGTIVRRELRGYFDHATAYILLVVFLGINFFFFFQSAFELGEASLRPMLGLLPWLFLFFVPAVCMRALAEERHEGTLELVLAQPISVTEFLLGKFFGVMSFLGIALLATVGVPLGLSLGADMHVGVIFAQYVGSLLLIGAMVAIGLWASSLTQNQVTAFILGVTISFILYMIGLEVVMLSLPPALSAIAGRLGILGHFENVARGVIDLRDVMYFAAVTAAFLSLTYFSLMRERLSRGGEAYRRLRFGVLGLVGLAILSALAGGQLRGRLDLTPGGLYTLSQPTRDLLGDLDDLVTIKFFRSDDLPPEYAPLRRDIEDVLRDFDTAGGPNVNLVQMAPDGDPEALAEAQTLGIPAAEFNVIGDSERSIRQGYLGISLQYAGETDIVPLVQQTSNLEYRLASMIRSLTARERPVIAVMEGHDELNPGTDMTFGGGAMNEEYTLQRLAVDATMSAIPDSIDVIVIAGPLRPFSPREGQLLGQFLDNGGSLFLMLNQSRLDLQSRRVAPTFHPVLDSLLSVYGLGVLRAVTYDPASNEQIPLQTAGGTVLQPYPLFPTALPNVEHPITQNANTLTLQWTSPLYLENADTARVTPLFVTTEYAAMFTIPAPIDPATDWQSIVDPAGVGEKVLAAAYQGENGTRIVLVGSRSFAGDETISGAPSGINGLVFLQNTVDWLAQDEALISIRSKDRAPPPLLFPSELSRDLAKWGNLLGVPVLFVLFGILRLSRRRRSQKRVFETGGALV